MSQSAEDFGAPARDGLYRLIQKQVSGGKVKIPLEIRLWGGHTYRFGEDEPAVKVLVKDRKGLEALRRLDELRICKAYMNGSLDVVGDMLGFVSLRRALSDSHPLYYLWRRIALWFIGRIPTDRQAIAAHYDFASEFYLQFLDLTRCFRRRCSKAMMKRWKRRGAASWILRSTPVGSSRKIAFWMLAAAGAGSRNMPDGAAFKSPR